MEENIAILIADLTGYTAMTETHGSFTAADIVEEFVEVSKNSLYGSCQLHQVVGDEVMIISPSPNDLALTAAMLLRNNARLNFSLQLHGGMHYGPILKRGNSLFGTTINLTSRIASNAKGGTICCSAAFVDALENKDDHHLEAIGKFSFKNLSEEIDVYQLMIETGTDIFIDPICRMLINDRAKAVVSDDGEIFFCSKQCKESYDRQQSAIDTSQ